MNNKLAIIFALAALGFGLPLVFLMPPFQAPDEPAHFYRAYQVSEGVFVAPSPGGQCGGDLPKSLPRIVEPFRHLNFRPKEKTSRNAILDELDLPLNAGDRQWIEFANVIYPPVVYMPQATAILLGRHAGLTPLRLMYAGRIANLLAFAILGFTSLCILPAFHRPIMMILLMPMMLYLAASLSGDVMTDALAILFSALVIRQSARNRSEPVSNAAIAAMAIVGLALTLTKIAYFPVVGLVLLIPRIRFGDQLRYACAVGLILGLSIAAEAYWATQTVGMNAQIHEQANAHQQLSLVLHDPARIPSVVWHTFERDAWGMIRTFVGARLGWMDTAIQQPFVPVYLILLIWSCWPAVDDAPGPGIARVILVTTASAASAMAIVAGLNYLFWDRVGDPWVDGLQGRYFIPVSPAIVLLISWGLLQMLPKRNWIHWPANQKNAIAISAVLASGVVTWLTVYFRYYV
jgi:uncharacterized membrane protein